MVEWTNPAKQDLKSIHDYIARISDSMQRRVNPIDDTVIPDSDSA